MTEYDIICMAREADCQRVTINWDHAMAVERLTRFASLVAAAEREACAKIADSEISKYPPGTPFNQYQSGIFTAAEHIDDAIRARGGHGKS